MQTAPPGAASLTDPRKLWRDANAILQAQGLGDMVKLERSPDAPLEREWNHENGKGVVRYADHEAVEFYYQAAKQFLHRHKFASDVQRRIWELHSETVSVKRIESILRREGRRGRVKHEVQTVIATLRTRMLNPSRRGRPRRPGGCYADGPRFTFRMQDGVWEALCHLEQHWRLDKQEVLRRLVFAAAQAI